MSTDIEDIAANTKIVNFLKEIENGKSIDQCKRKYKLHYKNNVLLTKFASLMNQKQIDLLTYKPVRSWSGVLVITVVMRPDKFSCPHNCYYCPNEPGQPRSYLSNEPAVARANEVKFDAVAQVYSRLCTLRKNGHKIDKLEIIVLGGTFSAYPRDYQREFIRDLFFAANTYNMYFDFETNMEYADSKLKGELENEQLCNENARHKIIGISLETRPDHINKYEIMRLRNYGCTRVQLGVQHTDNNILDYVNRGHHVEQSVKAIYLLRTHGFKIDIHIMPDLPGSTPEKDMIMIQKILEAPEFIPDYLKIYPCLDVDFTTIRTWKQNGKWQPYADSDNGEKITNVILHAKKLSKPYIRFNRIQRDFCEERENTIGYSSKNIRSNFRQMLHTTMAKHGITCKCIRCCEIKNNPIVSKLIKYKITTYNTFGGKEYFISCHCKQYLLGFIRLRINDERSQPFYDHLKNYAFIRELHVYGSVVPTNENSGKVQHLGIGKKLMYIAQCISFLHLKFNIAVISGVGVRMYYKKLGFNYENEGHYMIKCISLCQFIYYFFITLITMIHKYSF
jgi:ELP3 family radical SAM enzyme/protein acetyltransferase